jgi:protein-disulfide isomerase
MIQDNANAAEKISPATPRVDSLGMATLVGVVVMLSLSLWNVWNLNQLGARVARIEAQGGAVKAPSGPDPSRVYEITTQGAASKGPEGAPVTIVEFSDFQCPFCARVIPTLKDIERTYNGSVRIVWKHLPLSSIHDHAVGAALAAEAAGTQGKFWEFHDKLFANQDKLGPDDLKQHARDLRLDIGRFEADMRAAGESMKKIQADVEQARSLGVVSTPSTFINGRYISGAQPFETFANIINEELAKLNLPVPSKSTSN